MQHLMSNSSCFVAVRISMDSMLFQLSYCNVISDSPFEQIMTIKSVIYTLTITKTTQYYHVAYYYRVGWFFSGREQGQSVREES